MPGARFQPQRNICISNKKNTKEVPKATQEHPKETPKTTPELQTRPQETTQELPRPPKSPCHPSHSSFYLRLWPRASFILARHPASCRQQPSGGRAAVVPPGGLQSAARPFRDGEARAGSYLWFLVLALSYLVLVPFILPLHLSI